MEANDRIIRVKIQTQRDNPFFAYLLLHMKQQENKDVPTMGVDTNGNLFYSKEFVEKLSEEDLKLIILHETLHVALQHLLRRNKREAILWNIASDLIVNTVLDKNFRIDGTFIEKNGVTADFLKIQFGIEIENAEEKFVEEVYDLLNKEMDKKGKGNKGNQDFKSWVKGYSFDVHFDLDKLSEEDKRKLEQSLGKGFDEIKKDLEEGAKKLLTEAYNFQKLKGDVPLGLDRFFSEILKSRVSWKHLLYKYITQELPYDYTWNKPSKKSLSCGIYLPSTVKESLNLVVAVDTSGSIGQEEYNIFISEIIAIAKSFQNIKITVMACDCKIHSILEVSNGNIEKIKKLSLGGGGGTSFIPVFEHLQKNMLNAKLLIYLTDGYGDFPKSETIKTIWVITKQGVKEAEVPFGQVIKLD